MIDTSKPIIDPRSTVLSGQPQSFEPAASKVRQQESSTNTSDTLLGGGAKAALQQPDTEFRYTASNYEELISQLGKQIARYKPLSDAEVAKLRRRQKAEGIISGISDAVQSVANLMATHHYAPDMFDPTQGMSARAKERFEREKAERDADDEKFLNYALTLGKLRAAQDEKEYSRGRDALQDRIRLSQETRAQLKADRDAAMANLKMQLLQGKINEQEAAALAQEVEAEYAEQFWKSRIEEKQSATERNKAQARKADRWVPNTHSGGRSGGGKSSGSGGNWYAVDDKGNIHTLSAKGEANAHSVAAGHNWTLLTSSKQTSSENTTEDEYGFSKSSKKTSTSKNKTDRAGKSKGKKKIGW